MAIVTLDRVTLIGSQDCKDAVLKELQQLGCLHLVDLSEDSDERKVDSLVSAEAREALRYLRACPERRRQTKSDKGYDFAQIDDETLAIKQQCVSLEEERDELQKAIRHLKPWGDFNSVAAAELGGLRLWPFTLRHRDFQKLQETSLTWQVVGRDLEYLYVMILAEEQPTDVPATPVELDSRSLSELTSRLEELQEELEELHWQRVSLTRWCTRLAHDLDKADDVAGRRIAAKRLLDRGEVFALQAWCPRVATPEVRDLASERGAAVIVSPAGKDESPPTLLKNPERVAGAEGAVTFYIVPDYHTWDPTPIVYFSFSVFFGMITADAGYALVFGALVWMLRKPLGRSQSGQRFRNFLVGIVAASFIYGVMVGSYFGLGPPRFLAWLKIFDFDNQNMMMGLAVAVGVAHLSLANFVTAWRFRHSPRMLSPLGWASILIGGLIFAAGSMEPVPGAEWCRYAFQLSEADLGASLKVLGQVMLAGGFLAVLLFTSERPLWPLRFGNLAGRLLDGIGQIPRIPKAFGDVLSYLRLFALGLASAQLAVTFNGMASDMAEKSGPWFLLALLVVLAGHTINIALAIMSGVVHGLRLNVIEFFDWSLNEEGYCFQAFCQKAKE
jgi:V/A-type H+/Na+-transporting ATPase subunit I